MDTFRCQISRCSASLFLVRVVCRETDTHALVACKSRSWRHNGSSFENIMMVLEPQRSFWMCCKREQALMSCLARPPQNTFSPARGIDPQFHVSTFQFLQSYTRTRVSPFFWFCVLATPRHQGAFLSGGHTKRRRPGRFLNCVWQTGVGKGKRLKMLKASDALAGNRGSCTPLRGL